MRYGSDYLRHNGERCQISAGLFGERDARAGVTEAAVEIEWEPFRPDRTDGVIEVGYGWIDSL
jgi:hypothetical protein